MLLSVDISEFIILVFSQLLDVISEAVYILDSIIIFNGNDFGLGNFYVTLFDFSIGLVVISIVIGAFVHVNKADNFYSNRKD